MAILKLSEDNEEKEIIFELEQMEKLTIEERIQMMLEKSRYMVQMLKQHGHFPTPEIVKRTEG